MKLHHDYQPEDIEALLAEKPFSELYEEEKAFVLDHLSSSGEYERMREMLLAIRGGAGGEDTASGPSDRVKRDLLEEFAKEKRRRRALWWNSAGLWFRDSLRLDLPAVRVAFATVILVLAVWLGFSLAGGEKEPEIVKNNTPNVAPGTQPAVTPAVPQSKEENGFANVPNNVPANNNAPVVQPAAPEKRPAPQPVDRIANGPAPTTNVAKDNVIDPPPSKNLADNTPSNNSQRNPATNGATNLSNDSAPLTFSNNFMSPSTNGTANGNIAINDANNGFTNLSGTNGNVIQPVLRDSLTGAVICAGGSTMVTNASGAMTYSWTPTVTTNAVAPVFSTGNYAPRTCTPSIIPNDAIYVTGGTAPAGTGSRSRPLSASAQLIPLYFELK